MTRADGDPMTATGDTQASEHAAALSALLSMRIMTQIDGSCPLSLTSLAARLMLDRGQLSRAVKAMVAHGLLTRSRKPGGPEIEIDLSPRGSEIRAAMVERAAERDNFLMEGVDPHDQKVAFRVIEHMIARAELDIDEPDGEGSSSQTRPAVFYPHTYWHEILERT